MTGAASDDSARGVSPSEVSSSEVSSGEVSSPGARSIVVTVGDELLLGRTVDSNAAWLADRLAVLGAPVERIETVGDGDAVIAGAVERALVGTDLVVVTGGLGPTDDDRTLPAVRSLLDDAEPDALIQNPRGVQPGRWFVHGGPYRGLLLLPGPPREMTAVFEAAESRIVDLLGIRRRVVHHRTIATTGIPERRLAPLLQPRVDRVASVEIAFLPDLRGVDLRLTVRDLESGPAHSALDAAEAAIAEIVQPYRVPSASGDVVDALTDALLARGWTLALAESCTGGGIAERMTSRPGSSRIVLGGVVAYSNAAKTSLLDVSDELLAAHGAVSEPVAVAMAAGAVEAFGADCAIGITGIAGPGGGSEEKPVGTVCYAARTPEGDVVRTGRFIGDRDAVRQRSGQAALVQLLRSVEAA